MSALPCAQKALRTVTRGCAELRSLFPAIQTVQAADPQGAHFSEPSLNRLTAATSQFNSGTVSLIGNLDLGGWRAIKWGSTKLPIGPVLWTDWLVPSLGRAGLAHGHNTGSSLCRVALFSSHTTWNGHSVHPRRFTNRPVPYREWRRTWSHICHHSRELMHLSDT